MLRLLFLIAVSATLSTGYIMMKNLSLVTWAHAVNNKTFLEQTLASDVAMIEADVVLGHVTGQEGPPIPVMAHPPAATSDLSLSDFLSTVAQHNNVSPKQKGVKLDFKTMEAFEKAQSLIAPYSKPEVTFPLWLNADILAGPIGAEAKPLEPSRFFKLASAHHRAVLSIGWTTHVGGNVTEGEYSREHIGAMLRTVRENRVRQTITFAVRASIASNSQPVLLDLVRETSNLNSTMTVWSAAEDRVEAGRLRALILTVGLERTYLDVPKELADRLRLPPAANVKTY